MPDARRPVRSPREAFADPVPGPHESDGFHAPPQERMLHLRDYWQVVRRRWVTVLVCFLLIVGGTAAWTLTSRPVFTASALIRIEREEPRILKFDEVVQADLEEDYYQTQYNLLRSRSLANRVIGALRLDTHPDFAAVGPGARPDLRTRATLLVQDLVAWSRPAIEGLLGRWRTPAPPATPDPDDDLVPESPLTMAFLARLHVEPIPSTRLVRVYFDSHYPDLSARAINALAEAFIARHLDHKTEASRYATQFLTKQLDEVRGKLEESEGRLSRFLNQNDIHFVTPGRIGEGQDLVTQQLIVLSDAALKARSDRIERESALSQALGGDPTTIAPVLQSPVIAKLKADLLTFEGQRRQLAHMYRPTFEDQRIRELDAGIRALKRELALEVDRIVKSLESDYRSALAAERRFQRAIDRQRGLARRLGDQMVQYSLLRREVDTNRDLFSSLLSQVKETGITGALVSSNVSVVDPAEVPRHPSKPARNRNLALATFAGLLGGVGLALFREYMDTTVRDVREVESDLGVMALGLIPSWRRLDRGRARARGPFALVAHARKASGLAEAFRALRTSLLFSIADEAPRTLLLTSLRVNDGKTSLATNLAIVLAQLDVGEVLLVDADMRRPRLHDLLGVPQRPGLSACLADVATIADAVHETRIPGLHVLPSGDIPPNPAELLSSKRMRETLGVLRDHFAYVVVDAPPLLGVSDAMILAPQVDGVALVIRHGRSGREAAQRAVRSLVSVRARLLGVILNDVDVRGDAKDSGYYQYHPVEPGPL